MTAVIQDAVKTEIDKTHMSIMQKKNIVFHKISLFSPVFFHVFYSFVSFSKDLLTFDASTRHLRFCCGKILIS